MSKPEQQHTLTEQGRKAISLAEEEARRTKHNYIGTEHLLLGLIREGGLAARILLNLDVTLNKARSTVEFIIGRGDRIVLGEIGLTPRAQKVVEFAADEAQQLRQKTIGPEHLLLGILHMQDCIALGVLESMGANQQQIRTRLFEAIQASPKPEATALVAEGTPALVCPRCGSRCPEFFYYCYNCGQGLA